MLIGPNRKQPDKLEFEKGEQYKPIVYPGPQGPMIIGFVVFHPIKLSDQWSVKGWDGEYFASEALANELYIDWWWGYDDKFSYGLYNPADWQGQRRT